MPFFIKNLQYNFKYVIQKIFRPNHTSDRDLWNLDNHLAGIILPKIVAFKKLGRSSYPNDFIEYDSSYYPDKNNYDSRIASGELKGGGPEAWEITLDEIIFGFEWMVCCKYSTGKDKKSIEFYKKYGYKNPHAEIDENKYISYEYLMTKKYIDEQEEECPGLKDFGGLSPFVISEAPDLHIKEPDKYILKGQAIGYYDAEYAKKIEGRALNGLKLFGEYFIHLWD
jgi:hypothetical protein